MSADVAEMKAATRELIAKFNAANNVGGILEQHNYRRVKNRFVAPGKVDSDIVDFGDGKMYCHSQNDPLGTGHAVDAFEAFTILDHDGDRKAALKAAAEMLGEDVGTRPKPVRKDIVTIAPRDTLELWAQNLWQECGPVDGVARAYLEARGCVIPPADGDLRWHESLKHPTGYVGPALVARVTDAVTNKPISLHRTWIQSDGRKADVMPQRMLLKGHSKRLGVIRLWPDDAVTRGLAITEGIETAMAAAHAFTPVWSCIDAGNLAQFPVLDGIESLLIVADHDAAGIRAARTCAGRWTQAAKTVSVALPAKPGQDAADVVA